MSLFKFYFKLIRMKRKRKSFTGSFENYISKEQAKRTKEDHFLIYHISPVFNNLDGFDKELIKKILIAEIVGD